MKYRTPRYSLSVNFLLPLLCDSSPQAEKNILKKTTRVKQGDQDDGIFLTAEKGEKYYSEERENY